MKRDETRKNEKTREKMKNSRPKNRYQIELSSRILLMLKNYQKLEETRRNQKKPENTKKLTKTDKTGKYKILFDKTYEVLIIWRENEYKLYILYICMKSNCLLINTDKTSMLLNVMHNTRCYWFIIR